MQRMTAIYWGCVFATMLLSGAWVLAAADSDAVGLVVAVRGDVTITHEQGEASKPSLKDPVFRGDVVKTGKRGRVQLCFNDDGIISLGRDTELEITEFSWEPSEQTGTCRLNVKKGIFRVMGGAITKMAPDNFRVETPTATIGIRGSSCAGRTNSREGTFANTGGHLTVGNEYGSSETGIPGEGIRVEAGQPPSPPMPMTAFITNALNSMQMGRSDADDNGDDDGGGDGNRGNDNDNGGDDDGGGDDGDQKEGGVGTVAPKGQGGLVVGGVVEEVKKKTEEDEEEDEGDDSAPLGDDVNKEEEKKGTNLDETGSDLDPDGNIVAADEAETHYENGYAIARSDSDGWIHRNSVPSQVSVEIYTDAAEGEFVESGNLTLGVYEYRDANQDRTGTAPGAPLESPPMDFEIKNGEILSNDVVTVTESSFTVETDVPDTEKRYMRWGHWEMDIVDPNDLAVSKRLAGLWMVSPMEQTAVSVVNDYLSNDGPGFQGEYNGTAHCLRDGSDTLSGSSYFLVDFSTAEVTGDFDFSQSSGPQMGFHGDVTSAGFEGTITGVSGESVQASSLSGGFFGTNASAVGASFSAVTDLHSYVGVAGAEGGVTSGGTVSGVVTNP